MDRIPNSEELALMRGMANEEMVKDGRAPEEELRGAVTMNFALLERHFQRQPVQVASPYSLGHIHYIRRAQSMPGSILGDLSLVLTLDQHTGKYEVFITQIPTTESCKRKSGGRLYASQEIPAFVDSFLNENIESQE